jgi:hypothetical protein
MEAHISDGAVVGEARRQAAPYGLLYRTDLPSG